MSDTYETLAIARHDKVLTVTLNRPDVGNAFDGTMIQELMQLFSALPADPHVHVVVIAGAGKSFCAGADIRWMRSQGSLGKAENVTDALRTANFFEAVDACPKPIVGRIHGPARGGGVGLVAAIDIPVGSVGASFALTEVRLGLAPSIISPYVIRKIGARWARELFLTGEKVEAARALEVGLLNYVMPDDAALDAKVDEIVKMLLQGGPRALGACKDLARTIGGMEPAEATVKTANLIAELRASPEALEGMRAFLTKDKPAWTK
ncbi:MAG: enoyl-CoA hydratase-related protein [Myxococcota bacterium]